MTCVGSNSSGFLVASGGRDGKVCIWQWGQDHFFHQVCEQKIFLRCTHHGCVFFKVGQIYLSNLPIVYVQFGTNKGKEGEIWLAVDAYLINLKVWQRTSQLYMMEQQPSKNIRYVKVQLLG